MVVHLCSVINLLFLVLCSGTLRFSLAANRLRSFTSPHLNCTEEPGGDNRLIWTNALTFCKNQGGSLLSLYDKEDSKIISYFDNKTEMCTGFHQTWLGLKKVDNYNPTWSNGNPIIFSNSLVQLQNGEQLCEAIENRTWKGFNCSEEKTFICENGGIYKFFSIKKNWCQAMEHCRTYHGDLASIDGESQNEELNNKSHGNSCWIGLQHDKFKWADDSCSTYRVIPKNDSGYCFSASGDNEWQLKDCENIAYVICSKGRVKIQVIMESKTWEEALEYCTAKYSRLLWIENEEDQCAVKQWLKITNSTGRFWIGLRQSSIFGFWIWSDRIVHYHNWENGQQPEMPFSHHCGVINATTYKWSDEFCWSKLPFLCEEDIVYMSRKNVH